MTCLALLALKISQQKEVLLPSDLQSLWSFGASLCWPAGNLGGLCTLDEGILQAAYILDEGTLQAAYMPSRQTHELLDGLYETLVGG